MSIKKFTLVLVLFIACYTRLEAKNKATNKLHVLVDERMELLTTIQYLSGYPIITQANLRYKKEIDKYFRDFKDHNAVVLNRIIYRRFFGFDAPSTYIYHFSFPDFQQVAPFSEDDLRIYGFNEHADTLALLLKEFKDFYNKTNFHKFYLAHAAFYDSLVKPVKEKLMTPDIISIMENYYGEKNKEYNIVLVPLLHDGGYGPQIKTSKGNVFYAIIGPKYTSNAFPEFDIDHIISEYVIHEFSHSFCNPLINKYFNQLQKDSCLMEPIRAQMEEQGYGTWNACLCELLVRANEIKLTGQVFGQARADTAYNQMLKAGWIYLEGLEPMIVQYSESHQKHKTEDDIMPMVIQYFDEKAKNCK